MKLASFNSIVPAASVEDAAASPNGLYEVSAQFAQAVDERHFVCRLHVCTF